MKTCFSANLDSDCFINEILEIDSLVYPEGLRGSFASLSERFQRNRESYILAMDGGVIAGYFCFFPVNPELAGKIRGTGGFFDDGIKPDQVLPYGELNDIFLISAAVRPEWRNDLAIRLLSREFAAFFRKKENAGFHVKSLSCCAVSEDGERLAGRLGMRKKGGSVYLAERRELENLLNGPAY